MPLVLFAACEPTLPISLSMVGLCTPIMLHLSDELNE